MWGSGYWGGSQNQGCNIQTSNQQVPMQQATASPLLSASKQKINNKKSDIKKSESEKALLEAKQERLVKKIEKFFESEISDFIIQTHFEKMNKCEDYKTYPRHQCFLAEGQTSLSKETQTLCNGKDEVPLKLKDKWTTESGGYCNANSNSSRGQVQSALCSDASLRPSDAPKYRTFSVSECSQALSDYRKNKINLDNLQAKIEKSQEELSEIELADSDSSTPTDSQNRSRLESTEGGCEECALAARQGQAQKSNRDWWSTATNVIGGIGMLWYGKKIDESAQAYNAQLGYPSTNSYGYPYVNAGVSTIINGLSGTNSNCNNSANNMIASQYGIGSYGGFNTGFANATTSYAFGYPQTQLLQQLQSYNQIPITQRTPDVQVTIAQLQARLNAMNPSTSQYNYSTTYQTPTTYSGTTSYSGR